MIKRFLTIPVVQTIMTLMAGLGLVAGVYLWIDHRGYTRGFAAAEAVQKAEIAKTQAQLDRVSANLRKSAADLATAREANRMLSKGIDDEIRADPVINRCVPSPAELQRARRRWGVPN